jgi:hypothetical protein
MLIQHIGKSKYGKRTGVKYELFEFARMVFGLCNSPATYARVINLVLRKLKWRVVVAFLDDILVLGKPFEDYLENLKAVFLRI